MSAPDFVRRQRDHFREVDVAHFEWATSAPYIADGEAALLDGVEAPRGGRLVEVGCGEGGNLHHLAARLPGVRLFGVDFTLGKARFAAGRTGAATACCDARRLPFCNAAFDAVLVRDLLHHLPPGTQVEALSEAARVLRPGGRLALIEPNGRNPLIAAVAGLSAAERGMLRSTAARLVEAVRASGFEVLAVERRQALPLSRALLHYKVGAPSLGARPGVARALSRLERWAERLPRAVWAYVVIHAVIHPVSVGRKR